MLLPLLLNNMMGDGGEDPIPPTDSAGGRKRDKRRISWFFKFVSRG